MTLGFGELHKLSHAEQGLGLAANGDIEHGETASLLAAVPASPTASDTRLSAAAAQRETSSGLVFGLLLYAACTVCSSGMSILAKLAHAGGIPVMQIVFVRSAMVRSAAFTAELKHCMHDIVCVQALTACRRRARCCWTKSVCSLAFTLEIHHTDMHD